MNFRQLLYGIATFVPGLLPDRPGGGDSQSARYCYSVWLRHLVMAHARGYADVPKVVAELGPGNSLGVGLAALLSGAERCVALDVVAHSDLATNLDVFDELVTLFQARAPIPHDADMAEVKPALDDYGFPHTLLSDSVLDTSLDPARIAAIRASLIEPDTAQPYIVYKAPWNDAATIETDAVDMIYSQAVLEHVDDLSGTYQAMHSWLKPGGLMSHQIDFKCHGTASTWNGHWRYSDFLWRLYRGKRNHLINRMPFSHHQQLLTETGFEALFNRPVTSATELQRAQLAPRFRHLTDTDIRTSGAFMQATKPRPA